MTIESRRPCQGEGQHLFSFILLVFGFVLLQGFQAFFLAAKLLLGDLNSFGDGVHLLHEYLDPVQRASLGPGLDAAILSLALVLSLVQFYVIINRLAYTYVVLYGLLEFICDMGVALLFYFAASSLKTLCGVSMMIYDKYWLILCILYVTLAARMFLAAIRIAGMPAGDDDAAARTVHARAMTLVVGATGWYWVGAIIMMWGLMHARLSVSAEEMARVLLMGGVAMFGGHAVLAAIIFWFSRWRENARVSAVLVGPALLSGVAIVGTTAGMFTRSGWTHAILHYRHIFPWSTIQLGVMFLFLASIVITRRGARGRL